MEGNHRAAAMPAHCHFVAASCVFQALTEEVRKHPMASYSSEFGVKLEKNVQGGMAVFTGLSSMQALVKILLNAAA